MIKLNCREKKLRLVTRCAKARYWHSCDRWDVKLLNITLEHCPCANCGFRSGYLSGFHNTWLHSNESSQANLNFWNVLRFFIPLSVRNCSVIIIRCKIEYY